MKQQMRLLEEQKAEALQENLNLGIQLKQEQERVVSAYKMIIRRAPKAPWVRPQCDTTVLQFFI